MFWGGAVLLTLFSSVLIFGKTSQNIVLDEVTLKEYADNSNGMFAIMIENDEGEYEEYTDNTSWPMGMIFNDSMSGCIDNNGNTLDNVLSFNVSNNTASVSTSETSYCYLYFDVLCGEGSICYELISTSADAGGSDATLMLHEEGCDNYCAADGHYRYSGADEDVNNYICFGTSDLDTCLSDTDTYLFRIIEINPDDGAVKIIKATQLAGNSSYSSYSGTDDEYYFNSTDGTLDTGIAYNSYYYYWAVGSTLYATLATDLNTIYIDTFDDSWQDKILNYTWNIDGGNLAQSAYYYYNNIITTATFKIGLMSAYDYGYNFESSCWNYSLYNIGICVSYYGWLYSSNSEWLITAFTQGTVATVIYIHYNGYIYTLNSMYELNIRPVFYIDGNNLVYASGDGTYDSPYGVTLS